MFDSIFNTKARSREGGILSPEFPSDPQEQAAWVKAQARGVGFDLVGIAGVEPGGRGDFFRQWVEQGGHGAMGYLAQGLEERLDLRRRFPWLRSIISVGLSYYQSPREEPTFPAGKIARYAWGRNYHKVLGARLDRLEKAIRQSNLQSSDQPFEARSYVDTGPVMEREIAVRAGLGWIGKNTLLIRPGQGSWFLLGELLTSLELPADAPMTDHCGTCRRCIDACPTQALEPYRLEATRCLSYQTLENRGEIPVELQGPMGRAGFLVGCDICQEVCPHNRRPLLTQVGDWTEGPRRESLGLDEVLGWGIEAWDQATRGQGFRRTTLAMFVRNAGILAVDHPGPVGHPF